MKNANYPTATAAIAAEAEATATDSCMQTNRTVCLMRNPQHISVN